ncbi:MAG: histidine kinase [Erysipelotrichaceae bacterium]|nr:histidine kinase [Erysipelotrichaceae bacterium]
MELDQLLNLTSVVAGKSLPILGAVAIVFLIIFLRKLIRLMITTNDTISSLKITLDSASKQIDALDKPMQTLNDLSETVDHVHDASKSIMKSVLSALVENVSSVIKLAIRKTEEEPVIQEETSRGEEHE